MAVNPRFSCWLLKSCPSAPVPCKSRQATLSASRSLPSQHSWRSVTTAGNDSPPPCPHECAAPQPSPHHACVRHAPAPCESCDRMQASPAHLGKPSPTCAAPAARWRAREQWREAATLPCPSLLHHASLSESLQTISPISSRRTRVVSRRKHRKTAETTVYQNLDGGLSHCKCVLLCRSNLHCPNSTKGTQVGQRHVSISMPWV